MEIKSGGMYTRIGRRERGLRQYLACTFDYGALQYVFGMSHGAGFLVSEKNDILMA